jgi:lipopolysaccharide/colanic/teichoic acid biosynthesis glycosyltransferase
MRTKVAAYLFLLLDLAIIAGCFWAAYYLRYVVWGSSAGRAPGLSLYVWPLLLSMGLWLLISLILGFEQMIESWDTPTIIAGTIEAIIVLMVSVLTLSYLEKTFYSRLLLGFLGILLVAVLLSARLLEKHALGELRRRRIGGTRLVLVGTPRQTEELVREIQGRPQLGYEVVGTIMPTAGIEDESWGEEELAGDSERVLDLLSARRVHELLFAFPIANNPEILDFVARCQQRGIAVNVLSEFRDLYPFVQSARIGRLPVMKIISAPAGQGLKRVFDLVLAVFLWLLCLPVLIGVGALVALLGPRPVIQRRTRVGRFGVPFRMYSFAKPGLQPGCPPRAVSAGQFLDKYSFLELPQLLNVLRGDMSLVGPRPETPERVAYYSEWNKKRLMLKPGITGLAQVMGLRHEDSSDEKTRYDLEYIGNTSVTVDLVLLLRSVFTVIGRAFRRKGEPGEPPPGLTEEAPLTTSAAAGGP